MSTENFNDGRRVLTPYRFQENLQQKMVREGYQLRQELFPWELDQMQRYSELEPKFTGVGNSTKNSGSTFL